MELTTSYDQSESLKEREHHASKAASALVEAIAVAQDQLSNLETELGCVLTPERDSDEMMAGANPSPLVSPLAERLMSHAEAVSNLTERIRAIRGRLDLP
jgi:hypothetical protein